MFSLTFISPFSRSAEVTMISFGKSSADDKKVVEEKKRRNDSLLAEIPLRKAISSGKLNMLIAKGKIEVKRLGCVLSHKRSPEHNPFHVLKTHDSASPRYLVFFLAESVRASVVQRYNSSSTAARCKI